MSVTWNDNTYEDGDCIDYSEEDNFTERSRLVIQLAKNAGIKKERAVIITAVSWNESAAIITRRRSVPGPGYYSIQCWPCRPVLGWEWGRTNHVPYPIQDSQVLMKYLDDRGTALGSPLYKGKGDAMRWASPMSNYDGKVANVEQALLFEKIVQHRVAGALVAYSIGPTQQYLCYSPLVVNAYKAAGKTTPCNNGVRPERFATWEHLWKFYTAKNGGANYADPSYDYLPTGVVGFPVPGMVSCGDPNDPTCVEYYLQRYQTGNLNWQDAVWQGYAARFAQAVNMCWQLADSIYK